MRKLFRKFIESRQRYADEYILRHIARTEYPNESIEYVFQAIQERAKNA